MAINENLADRIREKLVEAGYSDVEEKKMFSGMCFMVNGKMCVCVSNNEMMLRLSPEDYETALESGHCRPMMQKDKPMKGYVYVAEDNLRNETVFNSWVQKALAFNKEAKASKKKPRKV